MEALGDDDFLDEWQDPDSQSQSESLSSSSDRYPLGYIIAKVVGLKHYTGEISSKEMVVLIRDPLNPYDSNAIKIFNSRMIQVGHIEGRVAAVLAPLMDEESIAVDGFISEISNSIAKKSKIPCEFHIFCRFEPLLSYVKSSILQAGLRLISGSDASSGLSALLNAKENNGRTLNKIFKLIDKDLSKNGNLGPLEPPKDVIKTELLFHQKQGLWWLAQKEYSSELPPFWQKKDGFYIHSLTNYKTNLRPEPLRGGIFADAVGLGKTLTLLCLIAFDKNPKALPFSISSGSSDEDIVDQIGQELGDEISVSSGIKGKRSRPSKKSSGSKGKRKTEDIHLANDLKGKSDGKTTLIVCPPSVFSTWLAQLRDHVKPDCFKVYMYHGQRRTDNVEELKKYDIVLTTYNTLAAEYYWPKSAAKEMTWWRVILDEAHMIKNPDALQSRAVCDLKANRRWVVTGTPIQNDSSDLFPLMAFLQFQPFSVKNYWQSLIQCPIAYGFEKGLMRLQVLMATISLRRMKDGELIGLPPKTIEIRHVDLSWEERAVYDQIESVARRILKGYIDSGGPAYSNATMLCMILRLRQICVDLALCPADIKAMLPSNSIEDVSSNLDLLRKIVEVLQDGEDLECSICISPPTDMVITRCGHIFCHSCILKAMEQTEQTEPTCPLCRHPLTNSDLFSAPQSSSTAGNEESSQKSTKSSKISALLEQLEVNSATKSVVFSQFRKMLILLEKPLKEAGFKILRIDGSMTAKKRAAVIEEFGASENNENTILLASLKASGMGISLTAASMVYFLEPWWNSAVEEQAMDRIHSIGQTQEVKIVRFIARDTVEEIILKEQERKKKLAKEAFGKSGPKDRSAMGIHDLRTLMSL